MWLIVVRGEKSCEIRGIMIAVVLYLPVLPLLWEQIRVWAGGWRGYYSPDHIHVLPCYLADHFGWVLLKTVKIDLPQKFTDK